MHWTYTPGETDAERVHQVMQYLELWAQGQQQYFRESEEEEKGMLWLHDEIAFRFYAVALLGFSLWLVK